MEAVKVLARYLSRLESGDLVGAADCFGESARYSHPPYVGDPPGAARHEAHGREAILTLFRRRGVRPTRHAITASAQAGDRCFVSGVIQDAAGSVVGSFLSEAVLDAASGLITQYAAYSSRPAVWTGPDGQ
jgi:hypothetical protein